MATDGSDDEVIFREAESVFAAFVRNANALGHDPRTVRAALRRVAEATSTDATSTEPPANEELPPEYDVDEVSTSAHVAAARVQLITPGKRAADPRASAETRVAHPPQIAVAPPRWDEDETAKETGPGGAPVVLLTRRRTLPPDTLSPLAGVASTSSSSAPLDTEVRTPTADDEMFVPTSPRGLTTQRREARALVPEVAGIAPQTVPLPERGEDGEIPPRVLARLLADMATLLRWGHEGQVRDELEKLRRRYPSDLLLMRRIAEFHLEVGQNEAAMDVLFALAGRLFERRNVEGMRAALEQVLVLDPANARARKLLSLLVKRDAAPR